MPIPKIIHYCWFGRNKKSELIEKCMESWSRILPDYEIIEWNEDNFDVNICRYTKEAYERKKWAFVSDYARLYALYNYGGLYFDTDVEVLKPLDAFLHHDFFSGFESKDSPITPAVIGAAKGNDLIKQLLDNYADRTFVKANGELDMTPNTQTITRFLLDVGIIKNGKKQLLDDGKVAIYPQIMFSPNNFSLIWGEPSPKSYTIHHFDGSWVDKKKAGPKTLTEKTRHYIVGLLRNTVGTETLNKIKKRK